MNALLLDLTLRGSVAFLLVWAADALLASRMQARWRRLWWILVPAVFLLPWKADVLPVPAAGMLLVPDRKTAFETIGAIGELAESSGLVLTWGVSVWLVGMLVCAGVIGVRTIRMSRRWAGARFSTDARLLGLLEDCKSLAGVRAPVGLIIESRSESPYLVGWLRPRIVLPESLAASADESRLRHVILHELAHFRSFDVPVGWLFAVARCVHWFNPFVHLASRQWAAFREEAADEDAIRWNRQEAAAAYGETLLALVRVEPLPPVGVLAIGETFSHLKHRIHMITRHAQRTPQIFTALLLSAGLVVLATCGWAQSSAPAASSAEDPISQAKAAATAAMEIWLQGIDAGKYAASWDAAAASFQKALTSEKWVQALTSVRAPLGALESRKLVSASYQSDILLPSGKTMKGEFVMAQFETSFANMKYAVETVSFEKQDSTWKAAGYFIKPR
jgi:beta-lactamase regulating signal transducer with metallopeptidase domain